LGKNNLKFELTKNLREKELLDKKNQDKKAVQNKG
jgi:hypothetical protein